MLPEAMVSSLGHDWLRSCTPLECLELLCTRRFEIKRGQRLAWTLLSQGCLDNHVAAACIPQRRVIWMEEETSGTALYGTGLVGGGRVILLWLS